MTLTVGDLVKDLVDLDPSLVIGIASDEEGNSFDTFSGFSFAVYNPDARYGEQFSSYVYDEDEDGDIDEDTERSVEEADATAIILWP